MVNSNSNHQVRWNDLQQRVSDSAKADILFLLQAFDSMGALFEWKARLDFSQPERPSRQEVIAARGMEGLNGQGNHVLLPELFIKLLDSYRHSDRVPTTETIHGRMENEDELLWSHMSSFRAPLSRNTASIPLRPCYRWACQSNVGELRAYHV